MIKDHDGEVMGCHESEAKAGKQLAALNIAEKKKGEMASIDEWQDAMDWALEQAES